MQYHTVSQTLAYEVVGLARSLDLNCSVTPSKTPKGDPCFVISFSQESLVSCQVNLVLYCKTKRDNLSSFKKGTLLDRKKYTPRLSDHCVRRRYSKVVSFC